jgi:hypothetical protein
VQVLETGLHVFVKPGGVRGNKLEAPGVGQKVAFQEVEVGLHVIGDLPGQLQLLLVELVFQDVFHLPVQPLPVGIEQEGENDGAGQDNSQDYGEGQGPSRPTRIHALLTSLKNVGNDIFYPSFPLLTREGPPG